MNGTMIQFFHWYTPGDSFLWKHVQESAHYLSELGITATADSFGPTTISKFNSKFPNGIKQQNSSDATENNIYAIIICE